MGHYLPLQIEMASLFSAPLNVFAITSGAGICWICSGLRKIELSHNGRQ